MAKKRIPNRQKTHPKKVKEPFVLTARHKQIIIAAAALVVLITTFFVVRYNMAALALDSDGKVITPEGRNWLVYNEKTTSNPRYIKLGEIEPAAGFALDKADFLTDKNEQIFYFKPIEEAAPVISYAAMVGKKNYKEIADSTITSVSAMLDGATAGEVQTANVGGRDVAYYLYSGGMKNADDPEKVDYYAKQMNAYVSAPSGKCVVMMIEQRSETGQDYADDAAFAAVLESAIAELKL